MYDGVLMQAGDVMIHQRFEILKRAIVETLPELFITLPLVDRFRVRGKERHVMPAAIGFQGDGGAGPASEDIRDTANAVDGNLRIARGDQHAHEAVSMGPVELQVHYIHSSHSPDAVQRESPSHDRDSFLRRRVARQLAFQFG